MREYIDKSVVNTLRDMAMASVNVGLMVAAAYIENMPTVDVVSVCRCKDCKWWVGAVPGCDTDVVRKCELAGYLVGSKGYCVYGEKR